MEFIKMHGLGNDFVFLDQFESVTDLGDRSYPELALKLCHRQFGVGGDGLIVVLPSEQADAKMRIFNSDGSEPEMCGNGIRCFARYIYDQGYVKKNPLQVETLAGILTLQLALEGDRVTGVTVDMGEPILKPEFIPVRAQREPVVAETIQVEGQEFKFTAVSMGNPHCVIFMENYESLDFERWGPAIEKHALFPRKTNVEFIVVNNRNELTMKVWERGAGPTLACGTGACASAVGAVLNGKTERKVTVHLPGGDLLIDWGSDNRVYMTGPATYVFRGIVLEDSLY
ncbi:diaminopimelate epimerase [Desulfitobacterium dichloroeliminans LMG P-21439]|uniref:Diaminopimelate epimerase n=1 Tax=Desulfitobacterium dichloroeliminans (strain LMG P-21439 / DCA1) TaxID=871963 RepID=L0F8L9_DESDL|nr:diaminopimelate epimerase [Desulfitobacterium dichloroeliminans]AGA70169.1 diaminopimelate epimerase [Desulfitobacterium dichloroeliminans LMG P-21439]